MDDAGIGRANERSKGKEKAIGESNYGVLILKFIKNQLETINISFLLLDIFHKNIVFCGIDSEKIILFPCLRQFICIFAAKIATI